MKIILFLAVSITTLNAYAVLFKTVESFEKQYGKPSMIFQNVRMYNKNIANFDSVGILILENKIHLIIYKKSNVSKSDIKTILPKHAPHNCHFKNIGQGNTLDLNVYVLVDNTGEPKILNSERICAVTTKTFIMICSERGKDVWFSLAKKWEKRGNAKSSYKSVEEFLNSLKGKAQTPEEVIRMAIKAAKKGEPAAQCFMAACFYRGIYGVPQNYESAFNWFKIAAMEGFAEAEFFLGICYFRGQGVSKNNYQAEVWFTKAAEHGHKEAKNILKTKK